MNITPKKHKDGLAIRNFPFALRMQAKQAAAGAQISLETWFEQVVRKAIEAGVEQADGREGK